jgi:uncharacterized protein (TIGR00106 family)
MFHVHVYIHVVNHTANFAISNHQHEAMFQDANKSHLEGPWDDVMRVIGQCHAMLHQNGIVRIQSDIRVGSRTDKKQAARDKVEAVERLLKEDQ